MHHRCDEERRLFHEYVAEALPSARERVLEWDAQLMPHPCTGWEVFATATYGGRGTLGLCWEMSPTAEFGHECTVATGLWLAAHSALTVNGMSLNGWEPRIRAAFPWLCAPIVAADKYLEPPGGNPYHVGFYQGAHWMWAFQQKQCWAGWPE